MRETALQKLRLIKKKGKEVLQVLEESSAVLEKTIAEQISTLQAVEDNRAGECMRSSAYGESAGSWSELPLMESSPLRILFSCRKCNPVKDPQWSSHRIIES